MPNQEMFDPVPCEFALVAVRPCRYRNSEGRSVVASAADAARYWKEQIATVPGFEAMVESLIVLFLDSQYRLIGHRLVAKGTANSVAITMVDIFMPALCAGACGIMIAHNHPTGDIEPSENDINQAGRFAIAGEFFSIPLVDFVVMGLPSRTDATDYSSLRERGLLEQAASPAGVANEATSAEVRLRFLDLVCKGTPGIEAAIANRAGAEEIDPSSPAALLLQRVYASRWLVDFVRDAVKREFKSA